MSEKDPDLTRLFESVRLIQEIQKFERERMEAMSANHRWLLALMAMMEGAPPERLFGNGVWFPPIFQTVAFLPEGGVVPLDEPDHKH
jgi:hypothetical protein